MKMLFSRILIAGLVLLLSGSSFSSIHAQNMESHGETLFSFELSYMAGQKDLLGNWMGGTEIIHLTEHKGKVYAAVGYWKDHPYFFDKENEPWTGAQILVKDASIIPWQVEENMGWFSVRVDGLKSIPICDAGGNAIDHLLIAGSSDYMDDSFSVWLRNDANGTWEKTTICSADIGESTRSFGYHLDEETGEYLIFAGTTKGRVFSGVVDASKPSEVKWNAEPEHVENNGRVRVMAFTEANGVLYCSIGDTLFKRIDGVQPYWQPLVLPEAISRGRENDPMVIRGLTTIPNPNGKGEVILFSRENTGQIFHLDPNQPAETFFELDVVSYFTQEWGDFNIPYMKTDSDPLLTSLDIYTPDREASLPVLIWVHGGGWRNGDKGNALLQASDDNLPKHLCSEGYVVVSVNYRLSPEAVFPTHARDVAAAASWVYDHIQEYGGDPSRLNIAGHSAGAHLTAFVACKEELLLEYGLTRSNFRTSVPVDTRAYNLESVAKQNDGKLPYYLEIIFSSDPEKWKEASPAYFVKSGSSDGSDIPPMLLYVSSGDAPVINPDKIELVEEFKNSLLDAGASASCYYAPEKNHNEIALAMGDPDDPVGQAFLQFLNQYNIK
jgi:acetyl esterase/lipase